jgi:uncharacterized delta-60 repeat protein
MMLSGQAVAERPMRALAHLIAVVSVVVAALAAAGPALASSPGALQPGFAGNGVYSAPAGVQVFGVATQPGGGTVLAGQSHGRAFAELLDPSGRVLRSWTGPSGVARAVAVDSAGALALAGSAGSAMFVERLSPSLGPDGSFGPGGQRQVFGGELGEANAVSFTPSGGVVAAGSIGGNDEDAVAVGFSPSGATQWVHDFGLPNSTIHGLAVQPNGDTVLVGSARATQLQGALVARLTGAGNLDRGFDGAGELIYTYPGSGLTVFNAVTVQSNGGILLAGSAAEGPTTLLARLSPGGQFDRGFGNGGVVATPAGSGVVDQSYAIGAYGIALGAGGKIVLAGNYENTGVQIDEALWAFYPSGRADTSFGTRGVALAPDGTDEACAVAALPDGNFVTAGDTTQLPDALPCTLRPGTQGFAAEFSGFGSLVSVPALRVSIAGLRRFYAKAPVHRHGIAFTVRCNQACSIAVLLKDGSRRVQSPYATLARAGARRIVLDGSGLRRLVYASRAAVRMNLVITVRSKLSSNSTTIRRMVSFVR